MPDTIESLRAEADKWKQLDAEAATHVESVICMRSRHFTGESPYVGWKGLGKALSEDYDDLAEAKVILEMITDDPVHWGNASNRASKWLARQKA